jgi:hypothetical protein
MQTYVSKELFKLHLHLAQSLSVDDWDLINRITTEKVLCMADDIRARHVPILANAPTPT